MSVPITARQLKTWKEIAGYIHRDTRTAKRYEAERGLPVHRMPGGGKSVVYAYAHEIDDWLRGPQASVEPPPDPPSASAAPPQAARRRPPLPMLLASVAGAALIVGAGAWAARGWRAPRHAVQQAQVLAWPEPAEASADPRAQALYLSGRFAWNRRTAAGLKRAAADFGQAARLDPRFAAAYVGLADTYNLMPEFGGPGPADAYPRAAAAAEQAVTLAPRSAAAHRALAFPLLYWRRDLAGSDREFRTSLALDPRSALTHHWYANALAARGDYEGALAQIQTAEALDPTNTAIKADKGWILYVGGRYVEATKVLQEVETVQPDYELAYLYMADVYDALGRPAAMLDQWRRAVAVSGDRRLRALSEAGLSALPRGPRAVLESVTAEAERRYAAGEGSPFALAIYEMRLARTDRALGYLEAAVRRHDPSAVAIPTTSAFHALKALPRFQQILRSARTTA